MERFSRKFLVLYFLLFCATPLFLLSRDITIIAHRGNSSEAPENTLSAFQSAADLGYPFIECDIHLTKDEIPVIAHDHILARTADNRYPIAIADLTLEQLQSLDFGSWFDHKFSGQKIITLTELLNTPLNDIGLMLEIKEESAAEEKIAEIVVHEVNRYSSKNKNRQILVGSKSPIIIKHVKEIAPNQPTIAIVDDVENLNQHHKNHPEQYALSKNLISDFLVSGIHLEGKKVWIWTVDEPEEMDLFIKKNVDGIITNQPGVLDKLLHSE